MMESSIKALIVDDDQSSRLILRTIVAEICDVQTCSSGREALSKLESFRPEVVLLDVEMPEMNGFQTCEQLRSQGFDGPIIFITAHLDVESHVKAYESGGTDLVTKPFDRALLLHKLKVAIATYSEKSSLAQEVSHLKTMAMNFLSTAGDGGILLNFMRNSITSKSFDELGGRLLEACGEFGLNCNVRVVNTGETIYLSNCREVNSMLRTVCDSLSTMGRIFQFSSQFVANYEHVTIVITDLNKVDPDRFGRIRDNIVTLAEIAEGLCDNVSMRVESMSRAERMQVAMLSAASAVESIREGHHAMLADVRILLQELIDNVENSYSWLNTSQSQEEAISTQMNESVSKVLEVISNGNDFDKGFSGLLTNLKGDESASDIELW